MTPQDVMTAFARSGPLPLEALQAAGQNRSEVLPEFLACIGRLLDSDVDTATEEDLSAFLFIFHLLGEWRDPSAYRPLLRLLRHDPDLLEALLGDGITETTARVIAGVFDGDMQPMFAAIEDDLADSFVRGQMFSALVMLVLEDPRLKPQVVDYLQRFFDQGSSDVPEEIWDSWVFAIAALGAAELKPLVAQVYAEERISTMLSTFGYFEAELQTTIETGTPAWFTKSSNATLISDAAKELSGWHCFSDEYLNPKPSPKGTDDPFLKMFEKPFEHHASQIGRNDPCPCGSGKKFKKCCLH